MKKGVAQITDAVIALGIFLIFFAIIIIPVSSYMIDQTRATVAATQAKRVQQAVNLYIKENHDTIAAKATATTPFVFGVPELISAGYLPTGFSTQNGFSATYQTRVFEPTVDKLNSMTFLNGGVKLSKSLARKIAIGVGSDGGIIEGNTAKGALGSWTTNLSVFGGYNPGEGSVVIAGFYNNGIKVSDYLYRKAVPGHPELNTMSTALNMGNNNVTNAGSITSKTLNATDTNSTNVNSTNVNSTNVNAKTTKTEGETYTGGWFRTTGDTGWYNEKHGGGFYMDDDTYIKSFNGKSIYTGGQLQAGTVQSNGRMTAGEYIQVNGIAVAGASCPSNGLIGRDATGGTLSCQSGVWSKSGSIGQTFYTEVTKMPSQGSPSTTTVTASYCSVSYSNVGSRYGADTTSGGCRINNSGNRWTLTALGSDRTSQTTCQAICIR